jgi:hypothetical protein
MSESVKKIIGQPLLIVSYKISLEKFFALGFANGYLLKIVSKGSCEKI